MTFEDWWLNFSSEHEEWRFADSEALRKAAYEAGAASRDAEIHRLQMALADTEALELGISEKCDQLREQVRMLREALLTCSAGDFSTGHVIYPSFDEKLVEEALAATEPKIAKPS